MFWSFHWYQSDIGIKTFPNWLSYTSSSNWLALMSYSCVFKYVIFKHWVVIYRTVTVKLSSAKCEQMWLVIGDISPLVQVMIGAVGQQTIAWGNVRFAHDGFQVMQCDAWQGQGFSNCFSGDGMSCKVRSDSCFYIILLKSTLSLWKELPKWTWRLFDRGTPAATVMFMMPCWSYSTCTDYMIWAVSCKGWSPDTR